MVFVFCLFFFFKLNKFTSLIYIYIDFSLHLSYMMIRSEASNENNKIVFHKFTIDLDLCNNIVHILSFRKLLLINQQQ